MTEDSQGTSPSNEPKMKAQLTPLKLIASSAVLILLGYGLCSAGGLRFEGPSTHPIVVGIGTVAFWGGVLGLGVGVLWQLIAIVSG